MPISYNDLQKLKHDKAQYILTPKGIEVNTNPLAKEVLTIPQDTEVFCPFCLSRNYLRKFFISTSKGISRRYAICPECKVQMLVETIVRMLKWSPEEYALFVWDYPAKLFWQKCSFQKWKRRLYLLNMSERFWNKYKELKGGYED